MFINPTYASIVADENFITEVANEPESAVFKLKEIATVIITQPNELSIENLLTLKKISTEIGRVYKAYVSKLNWLEQLFFSEEKTVNSTCARIAKLVNNYMFPLGLPKDLFPKVAQYLNASDLATTAELNCQVRPHAYTILIKRAQELGYEGTDNEDGKAGKYIRDIFGEVRQLYKPLPYYINIEVILQDIKNWKIEQAGRFFYEGVFRRLRKLYLSTLLEKKVDVNTRIKGKPLLYWAARDGHMKIAVELIKRGANIDELVNQRTILSELCANEHLYGQEGHIEAVELLLQNRADANFRINGVPILHLAVKNKYRYLVSCLIKYDARVDEHFDEHTTALSVALSEGCANVRYTYLEEYIAIAILLLDEGADPTIHVRGEPALQWVAKQEGYPDSYADLISRLERAIKENALRVE